MFLIICSGFVGRHFVLADDARSISFRRKGSFDHAGPNSLVDGRFFHDLFGQLVEHKAAPGNFGNHIALRFDGLVDDKPEGLSVLSLKRQENCRFFRASSIAGQNWLMGIDTGSR